MSIGTHKTSVINDSNITMVCYHNTPVVKITDTDIILNTGAGTLRPLNAV